MPSLPLTGKQLKVLKALRRFADIEGRSPSVRELASDLGLSCSTTHQHLKALERKGCIRMDGTANGLFIVDGAFDVFDRSEALHDSLVEVPLVGTIAAGAPIEAIELPEEPILLSPGMVGAGCYALRVRGDSMIDDHILDGDLIIVRPSPVVEQGVIAVAVLGDGCATLKRVYREKDHVRLQPANERLQALRVRDVTIRGAVVAVIRLPR